VERDFFVKKTAGKYDQVSTRDKVVNHKIQANNGLIKSGAGNL